MRMRTAPWLSTLAGALLVVGCLSGQTGSADCGPTAAQCVCPHLESSTVVRGTITEISGSMHRLTVDEVWRDDSGTVQPGTDVLVDSNRLGIRFYCSETLPPNVGDEMVAAFDATPLTGSPPGEMVVSAMPMIGYAPQVDFGDSVVVDAEELRSFADPEVCWDHLPNPTCDDSSGLCNAGPRPGPSHGWVTLVAAVVAVACLRRSRRRRALRPHPDEPSGCRGDAPSGGGASRGRGFLCGIKILIPHRTLAPRSVCVRHVSWSRRLPSPSRRRVRAGDWVA